MRINILNETFILLYFHILDITKVSKGHSTTTLIIRFLFWTNTINLAEQNNIQYLHFLYSQNKGSCVTERCPI